MADTFFVAEDVCSRWLFDQRIRPFGVQGEAFAVEQFESTSEMGKIFDAISSSLMDEEIAKLLAKLSPAERLKGLSPEQRLKGLSPEQVMEGLSSEEHERFLELLQQKVKNG